MKRIISMVLSVVILFSILPEAKAVSAESENISYISYEEYIQNYADSHNITYAEAEAIDRADNARIWNDYHIRNNLPLPRTVIYTTYNDLADAKIWYVKVEKTTNGTPSVTFGAQGKVIEDAHSKTFVPGSFTDSENDKYVLTLSEFFQLDTVSLSIDDSSYYNVYLSLVCTAKIAVNHALQIGGQAYWGSLGYDVSGTTYYTKRIDDFLNQTL